MNRKKAIRIVVALFVMGYYSYAEHHEGSHKPKEGSGHKHEEGSGNKHAEGSHGKTDSFKVTGEILDLACYLSSGAKGASHASCAKTCIKGGLPVGIKSDSDSKLYLIIGDHQSLNDKLASVAAETVTIEGKLVMRDGLSMITNASIQE